VWQVIATFFITEVVTGCQNFIAEGSASKAWQPWIGEESFLFYKQSKAHGTTLTLVGAPVINR
jgi:hypothetical protein